MSIIKVNPIVILDDGRERNYGDEDGTPEFYTVWVTLRKYLGEHIQVTWNYYDFTVEITEFSPDEGCDMVYDMVDILEHINEPIDEEYSKFRTLIFDIISIE